MTTKQITCQFQPYNNSIKVQTIEKTDKTIVDKISS